MTTPASCCVKVPSRGWRTVWIGRAILVVFVVYAAIGGLWLGVFPPNDGTLFFVGSTVVFLTLLGIGLESVRPRAVVMSRDGVAIEYLFSKTTLPWENVRKSNESRIPGLKDVPYDQIPRQGIGGRAYHWVTLEQSDAIERYRLTLGD